MEIVAAVLVLCLPVYLVILRNRERARNAPLRREIEARVCFEASLSGAGRLGSGSLAHMWIVLRGPKRLTVGTDAFMISAPQALREQ